jgi:type II secretory pathway component PulF
MTRNQLRARLFLDSGQREAVYDRLSALTSNGVSLLESLAVTLGRYERRRHPLRFVFREVTAGLNSGHSLDQALSPFIPGEEAMLISSGLQAGSLPDALGRCSDLLRARRKITSSISEALAYPAVLFVLFLVLLVVLSRYVMPQLAKLSNPANWSPAAQTLHAVSKFVDSCYGLIFFGVLVVTVITALSTLGSFTGPVRTRLDRVPPWSFYRLLVGSIWLYTLATLMRSGVQLSHALSSMIERPTTSAWLRERVSAIHGGLAHGQDLGTAMDNAGHEFPDRELVEDILVYSRLPGFSERLHAIAQAWLDSGIKRVQAQARAVNMVCILGILVILSGVGLAITSLQQQMGQTPY